MCTFEETESVTLFTKKNYKVAMRIGLTALCMHPINCDFTTSAGRILLPEDLVEADWLPLVPTCDSPRLKSATNQKVRFVGTVMLHVQIGEISVRVVFGIA